MCNTINLRFLDYHNDLDVTEVKEFNAFYDIGLIIVYNLGFYYW